MMFLEIEPGIWVAPELVTSVQGREDGSRGHRVDVHLLGGDIVRCREHMGPQFYAPENRPACYAAEEPIDFGAWGREDDLRLAAVHADAVQALIAEHRTPIEVRPL